MKLYTVNPFESVPISHTGWVLATLCNGFLTNLKRLAPVGLTPRVSWDQADIDNAVYNVHLYSLESKSEVFVTYCIEDQGMGQWFELREHRTWRQLVTVWFDRLNNVV